MKHKQKHNAITYKHTVFVWCPIEYITFWFVYVSHSVLSLFESTLKFTHLNYDADGSWCLSVVSASRCLSSRRTEPVVSFPGSVEERSTASSCSTWRNIVQRCACASKIPTAIAITAASSRAKTPEPRQPRPTTEESSSA